MAVLSNNPYAPEGLRVLGLDGHFEKIIAIDESDPRAKPNPSAFEMLTGDLGLAQGEVLYVGDSLFHDVVPARTAGLEAAWLDRFGAPGELPAGAHRIATLEELGPLLGRL
jgi:FMN phosphatase YigB (HAD superfamily)